MPPPRTIPSASAFHQRPHSMVMVQNRQSHSHSPPVHSSPLSPPSTGACSTGSDGSSLSIDETDSFVDPLTPDEGNGFPKVIKWVSPFASPFWTICLIWRKKITRLIQFSSPLSSGCSIPEENSDEYIHNYGRINQRLFGQHRSIEEFGSHVSHVHTPKCVLHSSHFPTSIYHQSTYSALLTLLLIVSKFKPFELQHHIKKKTQEVDQLFLEKKTCK